MTNSDTPKYFMQLFNQIQKNRRNSVSDDIFKIKELKETLFSDKVYKECITQHEDVIKFIPFDKLPRNLSTEVCILYFARTDEFRLLFKVPDHLRTKKVCLSALKNNGANLYWVDQDLIDEKIALVAMVHTEEYNWGSTLETIPEEFKTISFYTKSVFSKSELINLFNLKNVNSGMLF